MTADEMKAEKLFWHYLTAIDRYLCSATHKESEEQFMRRVEECIDIPEQAADDFRRQICVWAGHLYINIISRKIAWHANPILAKALRTYIGLGHPIPKWEGVTGKYRSIDDEWLGSRNGREGE